MMRSLYSGVSGLQNHQIRMDVVGNNVANVNTIGFKKGRVNFQDMISQNMGGAARPTEEVGGVNPKQVGLGMMVATIDTIHTQGSLQTTGVATDVSVSGNGFFIMSAGDKEYYTRAGAFGIDAEGKLVNPANGLRVQGWAAETINGASYVSTSKDVEDIYIPIGGKDPAQLTTEVEFACNLDKATPEVPADNPSEEDILAGTWTTNKVIYDTMGEEHLLEMQFTKVPGVNNQWSVAVTVDADRTLDNPNTTNTTLDIGDNGNADNTFIITFDNDGALLSATDGQGDIVDAGSLNIPVTFNVLGGTPDEGNEFYTQTFNLNLGEVGSFEESITQSASPSSTKAFRQNGYQLGYLESFRIDNKGVVTGVYSNGTNRPLAQLALASFVNPGGLEKAGETMFMRTINSGDANVGPAGIAGKGSFVAGALEMSNVDLSEQFTDMIVTQRGFQANSKTITTSDTMLQELLNLKR